MPIEVEREPGEHEPGAPYENCCFCVKPTAYWAHEPGKKEVTGASVACCRACALTHRESELPTKEVWWQREEQRIAKFRITRS